MPGLKLNHVSKRGHWGLVKTAAIFQTTFSDAFSWMKTFEFQTTFYRTMFLRMLFTIWQHWFREWLGDEQAKSHYLKQCWYAVHTHICVSLPQWVSSSPRCAAYMCIYATGLDHHWFGTKPLSEPMMKYYQPDPKEQTITYYNRVMPLYKWNRIQNNKLMTKRHRKHVCIWVCTVCWWCRTTGLLNGF